MVVDAGAAGSWQLGEMEVRRLGFGAMRLPQGGAALRAGAVPRDRAQAIAVLRRAVELGVNHIDTAAFYFSPLRSANELINSALGAPYPEDLLIATKVGPARDDAGEWADHAGTPAALRAQVERNLRELGRDRLDLVNLRVVGRDSLAERFGALAELRQAGLIRHLGVSNVDAAQLDEARAIAPVVCVQNRYGLGVAGTQEELLRRCGELGIAYVPFYAVAGAGGERGGVGGADGAVLEAVAAAHGATPAQVRIAWSLGRGPHVLAIPGTGDPAHLEQNVAAAAIRLTGAELEALESVHAGADA